ncbi:uncharacterized protein LOC109722156 isoform X1 [Ananas comosus]|uniref:Uncharacterized protein LOC109722156 isoform X1 n=1 Tax=Ananas comosus TaxID=4615 RepID=A0A6P5GK34_ANACO|nr:uncharacterized protein LOC109722156 isoform X1 [Ananas comosus]
MSTGRRTMRDLAEEAKKRIVLLLICVFGLSYLMSLTSSSVWINLPAAASLIIFCRYMLLDLDIRRKTIPCNTDSLVDQSVKRKSLELREFSLDKSEKSEWRKKVNSLAVEAAIEQFTRHLVSEWITDLWYSRITPDKDAPEELVNIMNNVLGEISSRARDVNLINLLTRDIINLICRQLELYYFCQAKIGKQNFVNLSVDSRDAELKLVLAAENKLHPALFSFHAEHKVLQQFANGLISITLKPEDLQCSFFRYTARELLACAVLRPVLNLANPRFINERIEALALSYANKSAKRTTTSAEESSVAKQNGPPMPSADQIAALMDRSSPGVELVQLRHDQSKTDVPKSNNQLSSTTSLSLDTQNISGKKNGIHSSGSEWAQALDIFSKRKSQALAPEHLDNIWAKGRNYKKKESTNQVTKRPAQNISTGNTHTAHPPVLPYNSSIQYHKHNATIHTEIPSPHDISNGLNHDTNISYQEREENNNEEVGPDSESSYPTDDENSTVMGLDSPGTRVWESKSRGNIGSSHIRHPLEASDFRDPKKSGKSHARNPWTMRTSSGRKRSRSSRLKVPLWQEVERTSFLTGDGQDILNPAKGNSRTEDLSYDPEMEALDRTFSGADASSLSSFSASESSYSLKYPDNNVLADSFIKLRCEVIGANIVKSGSGMFAVYSIAVTDANSNSWSIKRRFRHFEDLHRRLKEFPEYNLSLPPKHFLSSGLEVPVVQERCKLLDIYLKKLLQIPTVSGSIEVWDFLSVDSQTYMFTDSLSIVQTLSVALDDKPYEKGAKISSSTEDLNTYLSSIGQNLNASKEDAIRMNKNYNESDGFKLWKGNLEQNTGMNPKKEYPKLYQDNVGSDSESRNNIFSSNNSGKPKKVLSEENNSPQEAPQIVENMGNSGDSITPTEWTPPNLSVPILNLVDVIFQLHDGGWIRRQAFWVAKQLLQLGMGDAFDDWLIEKIQFLRKGAVIASAINRVEQILWPDGIFITKHPKRRPATTVSSSDAPANGMKGNILTEEQQLEASRRAKFVRELIVEKAPAALVSLVGRKEYERCAHDIYFFLQSPVCLKQLAFELLELLLLAAFPELDDIVRQIHEEKEQFGPVG